MIRAGPLSAFAFPADSTCLPYMNLEQLYALVLADEAAQATEVDTYAALLGVRRGGCLVLVGDHQQLPPHVESDAAKDKGQGVSLFQKLVQFVGMPVHRLLMQYRMHPAIGEVSSNLVYGGLLVDGPDVANRKAIPGLPWDWTNRFLWLHVDH